MWDKDFEIHRRLPFEYQAQGIFHKDLGSTLMKQIPTSGSFLAPALENNLHRSNCILCQQG